MREIKSHVCDLISISISDISVFGMGFAVTLKKMLEEKTFLLVLTVESRQRTCGFGSQGL